MTRAYNTATTQQNSGGAVAGVTAGKNLIINGAFDIWQRGTSFTGLLGNAYGADRWMFNNTTGRTYSRQSSGLDGFQYCLRVQRDSGQTSTNAPTVIYSNETVNSIPLQGKTVTLSYYARAGANFSAASSALTLDWKTGTGTDQNVYTAGYTGAVQVIGTSVTLTTSWQRFTHTFAVASNATEIGGTFAYTPVGTAGAADYYEITGVQIELGSVATPFSRNAGTIQSELAACQRYYFRIGGDSDYQTLATGCIVEGSIILAGVQNPVPMRVKPTSVDSSTLAVYDGSTLTSVTSVTLNLTSKYISRVNVGLASAPTTMRPYWLFTYNSLSGYIGFSAEL